MELWSQAVAEYRREGDRTREAITLNAIGLVHHDLGRPDSALAYYALALPIARALGDRTGEATALSNIGLAHRDLGRPDSALAYYAQALPIQRALRDHGGEATTLNNVGLAHSDLGRPDSALAYYALALPTQRAVGDHGGEATTLNNIGTVHSGLGRPDSALAYYALALPIRRAVGDRAGEAMTLNNIGLAHRDLSRPDSALAYYGLALPISRAVGDRTGEATTLNNIGTVHRDLGRPDSALAYLAQALPITRAVGDRTREATTLNNIGLAHHVLGRPDSALTYYALALPIERAVRNRTGEAMTLNNIGAVYRTLGRPDSALTYYAQALPIQHAVGDRTREATSLNNIGTIYLDLSRPDSALAYYAQALPIQRAVGDRAGEAVTLGNVAMSHQARTGPARFLAVAYYDSAAAVLASIAERAGGDQNRLSYAEQGVGLFRLWTIAWLDLASEVDTRSANLAALAAAERGRAQAMLDLMRASAADAAGGVGARSATTRAGADLAEEGERLVRSVAASGSASLSYLVTRRELIAWLSLADGEVYVSRVPVSEQELSAAVAALRSGLGADSAAVRDRMALRDAPLLEASRDLEMELASGEGAAEAAQRLANWLVPAELLARVPVSAELVIVPHGTLNLVPFAALPIGSNGESLGIRYALRYSPSLSTLVEIAGQGNGTDAAGARARALVIGDPAMPEVRSHTGAAVRLGQLAGAKAEGRWVADQVGVRSLTEGEATESRIRELLPRATLVHLATHGYAYGTEALARRSFVALAPDREHDGLLTVGEVLDEIPFLSAELVVLSACQTGLGELKQAEGTVGLQRAFLAKGARSVLVSLWSVSDRATDHLMRSFYGHWLSGKPKAEALRRAQEEVRAMPEFADPRYWAAFQLVGAP
ncbi:MAG: CHAT domain-containing protein [Gemmatimonadaceae bacterium]|nr:CHAT domain-containing protein [Gemmatimonadaceae bacterium]